MIREQILKIISNAISQTEGLKDTAVDFTIERPRLKQHGDWSTNIALNAAPILKKSPIQIAEILIENINDVAEAFRPPWKPEGFHYIKKVEIANPGFINFTFTNEWYHQVVERIEDADDTYGQIEADPSQKILLEYVSANPVGPLHVGHGRWAAVGDTLANVLRKAGHKVTTEFYVNNFGRQMLLFYESVVAAYFKEEPPEDGYKGAYITDIAESLRDDLEQELSEENRTKFEQLAFELVMKQIMKTLKKMGVTFEHYFYEKEELHNKNEVNKALDKLKKDAKAYEKDDALWLATSDFGDEKDRVLVRSNGEPTYFAADIAYHKQKLDRGYDKLINIWGADHHGYIARVKAAITALGDNPEKLQVILGQLVNLLKGGQVVKMSKRTGEMVTLDELVDEVGKDAVRYTLLTKSTDTTLDFDIDVAKEQSDQNPVYYVQYAHARINSIMRFAETKGIDYKKAAEANLELIKEDSEIDLIKSLEEFEDVITAIAKNYTPHLLTVYAQKLANNFHSFYAKHKVIDEENIELSQARLALLNATHIVLKNTLSLLGVSAPVKM